MSRASTTEVYRGFPSVSFRISVDFFDGDDVREVVLEMVGPASVSPNTMPGAMSRI